MPPRSGQSRRTRPPCPPCLAKQGVAHALEGAQLKYHGGLFAHGLERDAVGAQLELGLLGVEIAMPPQPYTAWLG